MAINFLQNNLDRTNVEETAVVFDLGGGSTQIVFGVRSHDAAGDYYYQLEFQGRHHQLYQHSYLGFGLIEARKQIKSTFAAARNGTLAFPCFPKGLAERSGESTLQGGEMSSWEACLPHVQAIFHRDSPCELAPCSFNGIHQPSFAQNRPLVAFSYIYDRTIPLGLTSPITLNQIAEVGRELCAVGLDDRSSRFTAHLRQTNEWCLDLAYVYTLLGYGYQIAPDQAITTTKQVNGYEAGWSLGLALKMLDGVGQTRVG